MIKYYNNNRIDFQQNQSFAGKLFVSVSVSEQLLYLFIYHLVFLDWRSSA